MKITPVHIVICACLILSAFLGGLYLGRNMRGGDIQISALTSQPSPATKSTSTAASSPTDAKININTADLYTLMRLEDIGEARAQDIIDYRETHGPFKCIEDIKNVSGIGDKRFEKIKDYITIGE